MTSDDCDTLVNFHDDCLGVYDGCSLTCFNHTLPSNIHSRFSQGAHYTIYRYVYPPLVLVTVISNLLVVLVLLQKHMRSPTNTILFYMSVADLCVALIPFPFFVFYLVLDGYKIEGSLTRAWCTIYIHGTDIWPPLCHNITIWLTVLLAAQRLAFIRFPMRARKWCSIKNVHIASLIIVVVAVLCQSPRLLEAENIRPARLRLTDNSSDYHEDCISTMSALVRAVGADPYMAFVLWLRAILFVTIPSILLVVLSMLLIKGIREANQRRARLMRENRTREALRQTEHNNTNRMLALIVVIFLLVNLPQGFFLVEICLEMQLNIRFLDSNAIMIATDIDNMLILATYPINFLIYCGMSTQFRETFCALFINTRVFIANHCHVPSILKCRSTSSVRSSLLKDEANKNKNSENKVASAVTLSENKVASAVTLVNGTNETRTVVPASVVPPTERLSSEFSFSKLMIESGTSL